MLFQMTDFTVNLADFSSYSLQHKNEKGTVFDMPYWLLTEAIKLVPVDKIPSFYMVNKYGEIYDQTQFVLVPYIRFMIADPRIVYTENKTNWGGEAEMRRTDYRQNPFHPYWIGGIGYNNMPSDSQNPNKYAFENMKNLMDIYAIPAWNQTDTTTHGIRNSNTKIMKLGGIGEDLVPNEGGLRNGMFIPAGARYMQASTTGSFTTGTNIHRLELSGVASQTRKDSIYRYLLNLPELSTDPNAPFILPPLFTDLFAWTTYNAMNSSIPFTDVSNRNEWNAISVLTFGVQPA